MLIKLAFRNVRRSFRDYSIYFITIALAVAVFYAFNSIADQQVLFDLQEGATSRMLDLTGQAVAMFSVAVAFVLGFLVVYANGFLVRRRRREFGTYLLLGMGSGRVSLVIVLEALIVGVVSAAVGLVVGYFASQGLSFVTAALMGQTIRTYHFVFSATALVRTLGAFGVAFLVTAIFNVVSINRTRLVSLLAHHASQPKLVVRRPWVCALVFAVSIVVLVCAYQQLAENKLVEIDGQFALATVLMIVGTLLLFWSLAGLITLVAQRMPAWRRGTTAFTVRQVASSLNAASISMAVIAVLLFLAVTTFSTGMGLAEVLGGNVAELTQFDMSVMQPTVFVEDAGQDSELYARSQQVYKRFDGDAAAAFRAADPYGWDALVKDAANIETYTLQDFTVDDLLAKLRIDPAGVPASGLFSNSHVLVQRVSQFNAVLALVGADPVVLENGEYMVNNTLSSTQELADTIAASNATLEMGGQKLRCAGTVHQQDCTAALASVTCYLIMPDSVVDGLLSSGEAKINGSYVDIQYAVSREQGDEQMAALLDAARESYSDSIWPSTQQFSASEMAEQAGGIRMLLVYLAVYIGFVFLVATAALLAIRQLCDAADSLSRYRVLAKLGCEPQRLFGSLRHQTEVYFLAPLAIALAHTAWAIHVMNMALFPATGFDVLASVIVAIVLVAVVYGGYLVITYLTAKGVVRQELTRAL